MTDNTFIFQPFAIFLLRYYARLYIIKYFKGNEIVQSKYRFKYGPISTYLNVPAGLNYGKVQSTENTKNQVMDQFEVIAFSI